MSNIKISVLCHVKYGNCRISKCLLILHLVKYGNFYILRIDIYNQEISIFDILQNIVFRVYHVKNGNCQLSFTADDTATNGDNHREGSALKLYKRNILPSSNIY